MKIVCWIYVLSTRYVFYRQTLSRDKIFKGLTAMPVSLLGSFKNLAKKACVLASMIYTWKSKSLNFKWILWHCSRLSKIITKCKKSKNRYTVLTYYSVMQTSHTKWRTKKRLKFLLETGSPKPRCYLQWRKNIKEMCYFLGKQKFIKILMAYYDDSWKILCSKPNPVSSVLSIIAEINCS